MKVKPKGKTTIEIAPSESLEADVAMMIKNEYVDAILLFTIEDVKVLVAQLEKYTK